ncbi:MAG: lactate racemase domain-containing protein [Candidatus Bathyarchaeia archaeon]
MVDFWLPYGESEVCLSVPGENFQAMLRPNETSAVSDVRVEITQTLNKPLGTGPLTELVRRGQSVCIALSDAVGKELAGEAVAAILDRLHKAGVDQDSVSLIHSNQTLHSESTDSTKPLLGQELANKLSFIEHGPSSKDSLEVGTTPLKTHVFLNKKFAEADIRILVDELNFHPCLGYTGGYTTVITVASSSRTIQHNHGLAVDPKSTASSTDENPCFHDAVEAGRLSQISFTLNLVKDPTGNLVRAVSGESETVFNEGKKLFDAIYRVGVEKFPNVVAVTPGGFPSDRDFFRALLAIENVASLSREGSVHILLSECREGHGSTQFLEIMNKRLSLVELKDEVRKRFTPGAYGAFLLTRAQEKSRIICVSAMPDSIASGVFKLRTARSAEDAMHMALRLGGKDARVLIVPQGKFVVPQYTPLQGPITERS